MEFLLKTDSGRTTLKLIGRFDAKSRQTFLTAFQTAREEHTKEIVIDLKEVPYVDSVGIGLIAVAHKRCKESSVVLSLRVCNNTVKQALDLMDIHKIIPIVADE